MKKFKKGSTKSVVLAIILTAVAIGSVAALYFYYVNWRQSEETAFFESEKILNTNQNKDISGNIQNSLKEEQKKEIVVDNTTDTEVELQNNSAKSIISKGEIQWQKPEFVGDLGYFKSRDGQCKSKKSKYYKTGKVVTGEYAGYNLYNIKGNVDCYGPFMDGFGFRILANGDKVIFFEGTRRFEDWEFDLLKEYIGGESAMHKINGNIILEDLTYPDEFKVGDTILQNKNYLTSTFFQDDSYNILKKIADSPQGEVWTTDRIKADAIYENKKDKTPQEIEIYEKFNTNAFYVKSPDSSVVQYTMKFPFLTESQQDDDRMAVLPLTRIDGTSNKEEYELYPVGCGVVRYVYDVTGQVDIHTDLVQIGTLSNGDKIYGYKDVNNPEFQKWYKDTYWEKDGSKKTESEILKENPQIFWVDPFGRTLAFYATKFISPAECGKPVIYLYPQRDMDVHVKVNPTQGFTITKPEYGENGWFVHATTNSIITNYADNKQYPYLFWEGNSDELLPNMEQIGFVVKKDELSQFFDSKLVELGLNSKEIVDFKEFWVPKMNAENKPYYQVTFLSKVFINKSAPLNIEPKPDTVIRVLMNYQGLEEYREIQEQKLHAPERKGFTVVEWGGILH